MADSTSAVARMWKAQQVELSADRQAKDDQREFDEQQGRTDGVLRGYRVLEQLRTYPSVVYLERIRSSEV